MSERRIARLIDRDAIIYVRPLKRSWTEPGKDGLLWQVHVEKVDKKIVTLYYSYTDSDLDVAIDNVCTMAEKKLGIQRKTRRRARRNT